MSYFLCFDASITHTHTHTHNIYIYIYILVSNVNSVDTMNQAPATPSAGFHMISLAEALQTVLRETVQLRVEMVPFELSSGHIVASDIYAAEPVPSYRASIKDGYAVVSADGPGEFPVVFEAHAGAAPAGPLQRGQVAYISTGGPVPEGSDAVVQVEDTEHTGVDGRVKILKQAKPGEDIREIGSDMRPGEIVMRKGEMIGSSEMGMLATVGVAEVPVFRKPHVAVLSTGDEVEEPSIKTLPTGKVRDANRCMLITAIQEVGGRSWDLGISRDSEDKVEKAVDEAIASGADILITTGGVSMGAKDYIKPILQRRGTIHFGKVRMKPGKPCTFATVPHGDSRLIVFGLPGNPVSALATFHLLVVPCLRTLAGHQDPSPTKIWVKTTFPITMDPQRTEYMRVTVKHVASGENDASGTYCAYSTGGQISSRIMSFQHANALLEVPQRKGILPEGTLLPAFMLSTSSSTACLQ